MKRYLLITWLFVFAAAFAAERADAKSQKPNVILFLIDDFGWAVLNVTGSTFYETPNVNQLAAEGVLFTDAYAASPVCSPTRASIMSGKYPSRIGMSYLAGTSGARGPNYRLIPPDVVGNVPHEDITLPEALREHGYITAHIGKWHLQGHGEHGNANYPEKHGFDVNIAGHRAGQPGSYHYPYTHKKHTWSNVPNMEDGKEGDERTHHNFGCQAVTEPDHQQWRDCDQWGRLECNCVGVQRVPNSSRVDERNGQETSC